MTPKASSGPLKHILIASVLLLCFGILFCIYYKPTISWMSCSEPKLNSYDVCTNACLNILNCTGNREELRVTTTTTSPPPRPARQDSSTERPPEVTVLVWAWPFGQKFDLDACESVYEIKSCRLTADRSQMDKADAVMFHLRDIRGDLSYLKTVSRPPRQKWVWMNMESPAHSPQLSGGEDLFNLTSNYRRDSDIWVPYGKLVEISEEHEKDFQIPQKDKLVCWIVSNWNPNYKRVGFYQELSKHIQVEAYGRHFGRYINKEDYTKVLSSCKFYLAFENSVYTDYITEKLFNTMKYGAVPVVLGPPRENYEEYIPSDSFIHVDDFKTPKELADYLTLLSQNQELYEKYFSWRKLFTVKNSGFGLDHACHICEHVRRNKNFRVFKNVNKWYFG